MAYQQSKSGRSQQRVCKVPQESKDLLWFFSKPLLWSFWGPVNGFRNSFLSVWPAIEKCQPISVFYFGSSQPHMVDSLFLYQLFNILILEKCEKKEPLYRPPLWSSSDFTINRQIIFSTGVEWYDVVFHIFCGYFSICFAEVAIALSLQITLTLEKNFQKEFLKQILIKNIATFAGKTCDLTNCPDMRKKFCPYLEPRAW